LQQTSQHPQPNNQYQDTVHPNNPFANVNNSQHVNYQNLMHINSMGYQNSQNSPQPTVVNDRPGRQGFNGQQHMPLFSGIMHEKRSLRSSSGNMVCAFFSRLCNFLL